MPIRRTTWFAVAALGVTAVLAGCQSSKPAGAGGLATPTAAVTTPAPAPDPTPTPRVTVTVTATAHPTESPATAPAGYFAGGKTYDAWVFKLHKDGTLAIRLGEHLTGTDAVTYLNSHGAPVGPDGLPDDYTNVDLGKQFTVSLSDTATITVNPEGSGPQTMTVAQFRTWLPKNLSVSIPSSERDKYTGAPHYFGTLLALTFTNGTIATVNQIFMP